ncbi:MAG: hypothetical protein QM731_17645 [Chitinophagaceae bacterium]
MNPLLLALHLLIHPAIDTTQYPFPFAIKKPAVEFSWKRYEINVTEAYRDSVLKSFRKVYPFYFENEYIENGPQLFKKAFHFVQLNGDNLPDLIYAGRSGGESNIVVLYLNRKNKFEQILTEFTHLLDLQFNGHNLIAATTINYGCCDEVIHFERHYSFDAALNSKLILQRASIQGMDAHDDDYKTPEHFFETPVKFKTLNEEYALRYSPNLNNDTLEGPFSLFNDEPEPKGNVIALYPKGSRGIAWAYQKDSTGREWWLVEMFPQILTTSRYYSLDDKLTNNFGWMSSRFVEKLP